MRAPRLPSHVAWNSAPPSRTGFGCDEPWFPLLRKDLNLSHRGLRRAGQTPEPAILIPKAFQPETLEAATGCARVSHEERLWRPDHSAPTGKTAIHGRPFRVQIASFLGA